MCIGMPSCFFFFFTKGNISCLSVCFTGSVLNPLYTNGHIHCYMLDESICYFRGVVSILSPLFYFRWKILLANNVDPDQMPHYVASDLGLHCLPMTLLQVSQ